MYPPFDKTLQEDIARGEIGRARWPGHWSTLLNPDVLTLVVRIRWNSIGIVERISPIKNIVISLKLEAANVYWIRTFVKLLHVMFSSRTFKGLLHALPIWHTMSWPLEFSMPPVCAHLHAPHHKWLGFACRQHCWCGTWIHQKVKFDIYS